MSAKVMESFLNVSFGLKIGLYMSHLPLLNLPSYFFLDEKVGKKSRL